MLGVPDELLEGAARLVPDMEPDDVKALVAAVRAFMDENGVTLHQEMDKIQPWLFFAKEGKRAFEDWGAR